MQKSFVVKATLCIEECQFYLRAGDVLMYDTVAHRLTVYRANAIVKTLNQTPIGISGFLKAGMIHEVSTPAPVAVPAPPKPALATGASVAPKPPAKKTGLTAEEFTPAVKRGKAQGKLVEEMPERLKQALATTEPIA
jgi:hypothetical protein